MHIIFYTGQTECIELRTTKNKYDIGFPIDYYTSDDDTIFLSFYVKGEKGAHIVLSPTPEPSKPGDAAYEILLGGWKNNGAAIRSV